MTRLELIGTVEVHRCPKGWGYLARVPLTDGQAAVAWGATGREARAQLALRLAAMVRESEATRLAMEMDLQSQVAQLRVELGIATKMDLQLQLAEARRHASELTDELKAVRESLEKREGVDG